MPLDHPSGRKQGDYLAQDMHFDTQNTELLQFSVSVLITGSKTQGRDCFLRREGAQCPMSDWGIWISVEDPVYYMGKMMRFCLLWEAHSAGEKLKLGRDMGVVQEKLSRMNSYFFTFGLVGTRDLASSPW